MQERGEGIPNIQETPASIDVTSAESEPVESTEVEGVENDGEQAEGDADESARETVERIFRETKEAADGDESGEEGEAETPPGAKKVRNAEAAQKVQPQQQKPTEFQIPAPARLNAKEKETFHALPNELKRAAHEMFRNQEALFTRANQQLQAEVREVNHIREAVRPYLLSHPELAEQGYTEGRFVSALVAAHQKLTDPKTARQAWLELGQNSQIGIDPDVLSGLKQALGGSGGQLADITNHPQFMALKQKLDQVTSKIDGAEKEKFEGTVSSILSEMERVREEKDQFGRYLYPELHDTAFLEQVKPLVSALVGAIPGIGYGDALKRAYHTIKGQPGNSAQVNQAKFPAQNEQLARAQQAAVSVRGRSAPSAPGDSRDIPPEALGNARDSVRWALNQLRRGV